MKRLLSYDRFNFVKEHMITEDTEFNQYQFGVGNASPLGPGYGFAVDPSLGIYTDRDSPYTDYYSRTSGLVKDLMDVIDYTRGSKAMSDVKFDYFIDDISKYENMKILRINENGSGWMDIFISFDFDGQDFFGVYKDFNKPYMKPVLESEIISGRHYDYMDKEYYLKLDNYLFKILENWFSPKKGFYKNHKELLPVRDSMGQEYDIKKNKVIEIVGQYTDENSKQYLEMKIDGELFRLAGNKYFYFNYWFEALPKFEL